MQQRYFTVVEANHLVPRLEAAFGRILRLRVQLRALADALDRLGKPLVAAAPADVVDEESPDVARRRGHARALLEMLNEEMAAIEAMGVEVKDLDIGLCDFVARHQGRDVLLCWRLGEKQVGFWHELHTGYASRRPLDATMQQLLH